MSTAPIRVGLLFDFPQHDGGDSFATAVELGLSTVSIDRPVELVRELAAGLPAGSAFDVEQKFASLEQQGVLAIVGPSISDNGLIVRELADACESAVHQLHRRRDHAQRVHVPLPGRLARRRAGRPRRAPRRPRASHRVAVVHDRSPVGRHYADWFELARVTVGIDITASGAIAPLAADATDMVGRLEASKPDGLVYLGLGVAARTVAVAVDSIGWHVPVVANSALMFGYARKDWRPLWDGWVVRRHDQRPQPAAGRVARAEPADRGRAGRRRRLRHRPPPRRGRRCAPTT